MLKTVFMVSLLFAGIPSFVIAQNLPRIGIVPLLNMSDDPGSDALAETVTRSIELNLGLLGQYQVLRVSESLRDTSPARLDALAARNRYENIVYGTIETPNRGTTEFRVAVFDHAAGAVTYENTWTITSLFEVFDTADLVVEAMIGQFSTERVTFGEIAFSNVGTRGDYRVYVDDSLLGENISRSRLLSGRYSIRIEQTRMFGPHVVHETDVAIPEDGTGQIQFSIPDLTAEEQSRIDDFLAQIQTVGSPIRRNIDFQGIVNRYIGLARDLEDTTYSAAVAQHRAEVENAFNDFVAWYSAEDEPAPVVESVATPEAAQPVESGILTVSTRTAGTLRVDGVEYASLSPGETLEIPGMDAGARQVEMIYEDGEQESRTVRIMNRGRGTVFFTHQESQPEAPAWRVGSRGPGGGIVFYDRGRELGGWRYLEAAPRDLSDDRVTWNNARTLARQYSANGYSDWRLPTRRELEMMYEQRNAIRNMVSARYWTGNENNRFTAYNRNFLTGAEASALKAFLSGRARAVRSF